MPVSDPIKAIEALKKRWVTPWGLVLGWLMLFGIVASLLHDVALKARIGIAAVLVVLLAIVWHRSRSAPKTKRGKVGFVISLECETSEQSRKVRADFVKTLHDLIKRGESGSSFQVIELPDHIARRIKDSEDANDLRKRLRSHFLLYGRLRTREIDGKPHHFLNMEGVVSHSGR